VSRVKSVRTIGLLVVAAAILAATPAFAQTDFSGEWALKDNEVFESAGQPPLGDYLGIPFNAAGRMRAETSAESIWATPEFQCRPHSAPYQWRGNGGVRFQKEIDPVSRELKAYHLQYWRSLDRPIYLDGRPHPPAYAPHSWTGFSTGTWAGDTLVVTTTHLKDSYLRRGGPQTSDQYTMTEYISRQGDLLTVVVMVDDPIYLSEPFVQSMTFQLSIHTQLQLEPCTSSFDENGGNDPHFVPHYLPGKNEFLTEWLEKEPWIPAAGARGGAETLYPEFLGTLAASRSPAAGPAAGPAARPAAAPVAAGSAPATAAAAAGTAPFSKPAFSPAANIAAESPRDGEVHVLPIQGNVYMLVADGSNITVSIGPDGFLLVDAAAAKMSDKVLATIKQLSAAVASPVMPNRCTGAHCAGTYEWSSPFMNSIISSPEPAKPIRYIIDTSVDADHTGGNEKLAAAGTFYIGGCIQAGCELHRLDNLAAIIAHENVLNRMSDADGAAPARPAAAWPTDTYHRDFFKLTSYFNGEPVVVYHEPAAHSDGDSIVYFRHSEVISAGELFSTVSYPVIDLARGGSIQGVINGLNHILDLAVAEYRSQGGTWIVPGHGRLSDVADLASYRNMVVMIRDRVQDMIKSRMTLAQIKAARPTLDFDGRFGSTTGSWTTDMVLEAVYRSLTPPVTTATAAKETAR
jgi:glyoxylase-like metal-dependent hydrolase (beta-lactamase superfamily II)